MGKNYKPLVDYVKEQNSFPLRIQIDYVELILGFALADCLKRTSYKWRREKGKNTPANALLDAGYKAEWDTDNSIIITRLDSVVGTQTNEKVKTRRNKKDSNKSETVESIDIDNLYKKECKNKINLRSKRKKLKVKIGCLIQTEDFINDRALNNPDRERLTEELKKKDFDFDILVCPEYTYFGFDECFHACDVIGLLNDKNPISTLKHTFSAANDFSRKINKAIYICGKDSNGYIFGIYINNKKIKCKNDTEFQVYLKHTNPNTERILINELNQEQYRLAAKKFSLFEPVKYKNTLIGLSICMDSNSPIVSSRYKNVDVIINGTGGNVSRDKWSIHNSSRAIENKCYNFITMGKITEGGARVRGVTLSMAFDCEGNLISPSGTVELNGKSWLDIYDKHSKPFTKNNDNREPKVGDTIGVNLSSGDIFNGKEYRYVPLDKYDVVFCYIKDKVIFNSRKMLLILFGLYLNYKNQYNKFVIVNQWNNNKLKNRPLLKNKIRILMGSLSMYAYCTTIISYKDTCDYFWLKNRVKELLSKFDLQMNEVMRIPVKFSAFTLFNGPENTIANLIEMMKNY